MKLFDSPFANRLAIGKTLGFVIGLIGFFLIPIVFNNNDLLIRIGVLLWYTTFGAIIALFGIINEHPVFKFKMPFWIRGTLIGAWLNFVLAFFAFDELTILMQQTVFDGCSPFLIAIEGAIIGFLIDLISTKCFGEGKKILK